MKAGEWLYLCAAHSAANEVGTADVAEALLTLAVDGVLRCEWIAA